MKYKFVPVALLLVIALGSCKRHTSKDLSKESLIPKPLSAKATGSSFEITNKTSIYVASQAHEVLSIAQHLANKLKPSTGYDIKVAYAEGPENGNIFIRMSDDPSLGEEGYDLEVTEDLVTLSASKPAGLFWGIQTIRQLLPPAIEATTVQQGPWELATGTIHDIPTYAWRGSMLDVARHFFSVDDVKRYIDLISFYKINTLHLHLSDDQGWRIEIKSWPNLATHGGSLQVGGGKGGYYTQEQYSDIVDYAKKRYVTIVPEIDLPGHINAALASYGELNAGTVVPVEGRIEVVKTSGILGGKQKPTELYTGTEVGFSTLSLKKEATFRFINDVIRELSSITPGPYIHIGGDEARATKKEDYIEFINKISEIVKANNKKMIGWEEIAQGNIDQNATIQLWHSNEYGVMGVEKGSKVVMSPARKAYLDMQYDSTSRLGLHWAGYIEVDSAYQWDPASYAKGITQRDILGVEAALWTETVTNMNDIEYMVFPRLSGYAEIGWTPATERNWEEYKVRLGNHAPRYKALDIDFYKSKRVPWVDQKELH